MEFSGWGVSSHLVNWHSGSFQVNVAGFLASGFWRHFLCSWRRLAFAALGTGWSGALPARPRSCAPPTLWASAPSLGLFHVKGTVRKTISFPQQSLWEVPTLRGLWPSRCPKFSTDSHVNLTCPWHTEGPGERRSWAPAPSFPAQGWISPLAVRESSLGS